MPACRKCKKDIPEGGAYCPWCGVPVEQKRVTHRRGNGQGTAYRRGKTWTARVVIGWKAAEDKKPSPIYRTKGGFSTKRDALAYTSMLKLDKPKEKAPKLIEYWETYCSGEFQQLSKSKQTAYSGAWNKLSAIHYRPVDQLTVSEIRENVSRVANTYYTVRDCKTVLTRLFDLAGADGWCNKNLPSYIVLPKLEEKERQVFSEEEQLGLWKLYESGDIRAAIPILMICTGMMPGEMQRLKVENIDMEGHKIIGIGMKTRVRKESPVFLPNDILPVVEDLINNAQPSGYLFVRSEDRWYADYYAALVAAGCRRLEPYCCRHTTATRLAITEGVAPQTVRRMMRWSTTKMLDRYAHPDDSDVLEAANRIKKVVQDS